MQTQQTVRPDQPISVTLTATEWNQVLGILSRGKYHVVAPLIGRIHEQAQSGSNGVGNGLDRGELTGDPAHVSDRQ